jgi:uncharacterized protein (DUF885 family)
MRSIVAVLAILAAASPNRAEPQDPKARLDAIIAEEWGRELADDPLLATAVGDPRYDDRLPDVAPAALERQAARQRGVLAELRRMDRSALTPADRINLDLFIRRLDESVRSFELGAQRLPITSDSGFHTDIVRLPEEVPLADVRGYENYLARLRAIPAYFDQQIAWLREGLRTGFTVPRIVLDGYDQTIRPHAEAQPESSVFMAPFESFPPGMPEAQCARLRDAGRAAIAGSVLPAYGRLLGFFTDEYIPHARTSIAASDLPDGRAYYAWLVRHFTTLDRTPEHVHEIGKAEVERIRAEMDGVKKRTGFEGTFDEFLGFLRSDPRFYARTPDELLDRASRIAKRMDGKLPALFRRFPRQPYGVEPVPDDLAPKYTAGRYVGAPLDGTRGGTYWVNTHALRSRPLYALEALTLHEAVPGHHFQVALSKELTGIPTFRRYAYVDAFGEGWGLYSERLGLEVGFYADPYADFGRLTYEMWRACRLVVDTGIHAFGWTRERAIDYMARNTALSLHEVETEIDRYISWPGQALAYKTGEMEIRRLRQRAEDALGERFDLRAFHDAVLENGSLPLPMLAERIEAFLADVSGR